jgi:predicted RND superfamily exporter protein
MRAKQVIFFIFVVVLIVGSFGVQASTVIGDVIQYDTEAVVNEGKAGKREG